MKYDIKDSQFWAEEASPRPWRIDHITRQGEAVIKAANDAIVAVCHKDNAAEIVRCVNAMNEDKQPEILPCPFCGGKCAVVFDENAVIPLHRWYVDCPECSYENSSDTKTNVILRHNELAKKALKGETK